MNNLDRQYQALLQDILDNGVTKSDRTETGTISVFGRQIRHSMKDGFPLITTKRIPFRLVTVELLWFLRGDTNIKYLIDNDCHIWDGDAYQNYLNTYKGNFEMDMEEFVEAIKTNPEFANVYGDLGPVYGKQWRNWSGIDRDAFLNTDNIKDPLLGGRGLFFKEYEIDQIANLINDLKTNPDSRRLMVNAWNVGELDSMVLPPCHYGFQVYTREFSPIEIVEQAKKDGLWLSEIPWGVTLSDVQQNFKTRAISLIWNQRSCDTFLGLPFNIASYGLLLEIIAKAVNMVPDELIGNLGDTHLYSNHIEQAKEQIGRELYPLPTLNINTEWWPREGEEGPLNAISIFEGFKDDNFCKCLLEEDIQLSNYLSHPSIKAPLSN
jgi:thymidylate synthase